jgi:hypothetical protein
LIKKVSGGMALAKNVHKISFMMHKDSLSKKKGLTKVKVNSKLYVPKVGLVILTAERRIKEILTSKTTMEGAGVKLERIFGFKDVPKLDPFLLLDNFGSKKPRDYLKGFPWHPHRGIETITYVIEGIVEHQDSLGNNGIIKSGDVQWMTAGSGIVHQEMPLESKPKLTGFQLWANLPAEHKMMAPRYRDITSEDIPEVQLNDKVSVKVIAGTINGTTGPVRDIITEPQYFDVRMEPNSNFKFQTDSDHTVFTFVYQGEGFFNTKASQKASTNQLVLFDSGNFITAKTKDQPVSFILVTGKPIDEPIFWRGPIVMTSQEELDQAFQDFFNGTFIKKKQK